MKIDDPVQCIPVHGLCGIWGIIAVGIFAEKSELRQNGSQMGVAKGGSWSFFGYQCLACLCISTWAAVTCVIQVCYLYSSLSQNSLSHHSMLFNF